MSLYDNKFMEYYNYIFTDLAGNWAWWHFLNLFFTYYTQNNRDIIWEKENNSKNENGWEKKPQQNNMKNIPTSLVRLWIIMSERHFPSLIFNLMLIIKLQLMHILMADFCCGRFCSVFFSILAWLLVPVHILFMCECVRVRMLRCENEK